MGTNYYIDINKCESCGRKDQIHLGKSSMGWQFTFQYNGGKYYKNVDEMKEFLNDKQIYCEYNGEISNKEFWEMVKTKQIPDNKNHAEYMISGEAEYYPPGEAKKFNYVIDGYSFTDSEFS